jgi:Protein of unknown function (DUF4019)
VDAPVKPLQEDGSDATSGRSRASYEEESESMEMQAAAVPRFRRQSVTSEWEPSRAASTARQDTLLWLSALGLLGLGRPLRMSSRDQHDATVAASSWLALVDAGLDDLSWDEAAPVLRLAVGREAWRTAVRAARGSLGWCVSRRLRSRVPVEAPAEAPKGPYVVVRFESTFEGSARAVETVLPALGPDRRWRVAAYFIETPVPRSPRSHREGRPGSR